MKQVAILAALLGLCYCGRLDSQYLPPNQGGGFKQSNQGGNYNQGSYSQSSYNDYNKAQSQSFSGSSGHSAPSGPAGPINKAANDVPILKLDNNNDGETYNYLLETGDGISVQEQGDARGDGTNAQGGFAYTAPNGEQIQISYTAGENGFIPQGPHLPTAPPVPEEIQKAVEKNLADEANGIYDDGSYKEEASNYEAHKSQGKFGGYREESSASQNKFNFQSQKQYVPPAAPNQGHQGQGGYKY